MKGVRRSKRRDAVLFAHLRRGLTLGESIEAAGYSISGVWQWRQADPEYNDAVEAAINEGGGRKYGRKPLYETPEQLEAAIDTWWRTCVETGKQPTWTGLALALGFTSRLALDNQEVREGFSEIVSRARLVVENAYEERLAGPAAAGAIFALKNIGWSDKQEHEHLGPGGGPVETIVRRIIQAEAVETPDEEDELDDE